MSLLAGFNWFFNPAWAVQKLFTLWGDGGGSSAPTQTTVQNSNLPEYVQPYVTSMLGAAQNQMFNMDSSGNITGFKPYTPYSTDMNNYVAGFSPLQQQAQQGTANLSLPGQFQAGSQLAGASGMGALGMTNTLANTGANYASQATNPNAVGSYMSPYLQNSLQPQLDEMRRQYGITGTQQAGQATQAGAFGGSRDALMASENNRNMNMAMNQAIGTGYNNAFNNAQQQMQYGANLGLQGNQAALQGYGQAGQAGATLGQLGQQQLTGQEGILNAQSAMGAQQQTQEQNKINQAIQNYAQQQQMPLQSLSNLSGLLHGLPLQNTTTQSYQAAPSNISQIAGLGTGIAGISKLAAEGGVMKSYAGGGITSLENRQRIAANYPPQQLQAEVQRGVLPQGIGGVLSQDYTNMAGRAQQSQAAEQVAQRAAQAAAAVPDEATGVTGLSSNLPVMSAAQGGIVAFAGDTDGSYVKENSTTKITKDPIHWDYEAEKPDYTQADAMITAAQAQPHDMDTVAAARTAEEGKRGITDVYTPMLSDLKAKEAALSGKRDQAQGLALLAAGAKMMGSTSPYAGVGIGAGLGEYASNYGAASEKLDALKENYSQQNNNIMLAQNAYKEAALNNDTNRMDKAKATITAAQENKQKLQQEYLKLKDTGNLEEAKATSHYYTEIDKEKQISGREKDTDLRNTTNIYYKDMVENKGYPANSATMALARQTAYKDTGLAERKVMVQEDAAAANLTHQQNQDLTAAKKTDPILKGLSLERMSALGDATALATVDGKIAAREKELEVGIRNGKVKPGAGAGSNKPADNVQSANKFVLDGFVFPDQKSLDAYKKAKNGS